MIPDSSEDEGRPRFPGRLASWSLSRARQAVRGAVPPLSLALLPFLVFAPIALLDRVFSAQDVQAYFFPYHVLSARTLWHGHLPLWNPYVFCGIPLLGDGQTAMFYPPNWLFFVLPGPAALNYDVLLQFSIAGVGTYQFARALGCWRLPSFVAALSYMFSGVLTARVVHLSIMSGAALMPWVLVCLDRLLDAASHATGGRTRRRWFAAATIAIALQMFAGHPQVPIYTGMAAFLYTIVRSAARAAAERSWRPIAAGPLLLLGAYTAAGALAAVQLLPWAEFARLSVRAAGADFSFVFETSTTGAEWLLFLFPHLLGAPGRSLFSDAPITIEQSVRAWEHSGYVGLLPLALAAVALWHFAVVTVRFGVPAPAAPYASPHVASARDRWYTLLFLLVLLAGGVILAAGRHTSVSHLVYAIPILGSLRGVERALVLASFSLTVLAGLGLQGILEGHRRTPWLLVPGILIVLVPALLIWLASHPIHGSWLGVSPQDIGRLSLLKPNTFIPLSFAIGSGLPFVLWSRSPRSASARVLTVALVLADLGLYAVSFNRTASGRLFEYRPEILRALPSSGEPFRKATVIVATNDVVGRPAQDVLALSWGMVHGIEDVNGFNSLQPRRYTDYLFGPQQSEVSYGYLRNPALFQAGNPILDSLNVQYLLVPFGTNVNLDDRWRPAFENFNVRVYENTQPHPHAYFPERIRTERDSRAVLQKVTSPGFDGRREAFVEGGAPPVPDALSPATARSVRSSPNELRVATTTAETRLLVVSEMDFPGWRAYVDGSETRIYRSNYLFRGVVVPAGQHVVVFRYRPLSVLVGAAVSCSAMGLIVILLVYPSSGRISAGGRIRPEPPRGWSSASRVPRRS